MKYVFIFLLFASTSLFAHTFVSGKSQIHLLELYTSEGCSSCPPAERWLTTLRTEKDLWKKFVPIEFHVTYWNKLGWLDSFSRDEYTQRQYNWASEFKTTKVFTPQFIVDGENLNPSLSSLEKKGKDVGDLKITRDVEMYRAQFTPLKNSSTPLYLNLALLENNHSTKVLSGENARKTLPHEFVVVEMRRMEMKEAKGVYQTEILLKHPTSNNKRSFAAWVTEGKSLKPLQAVGGDL
jgi:hypothetical protein